MEVIYYPDPRDEAFNYEVEKILPYAFGDGLDIGCGGRSINKEIDRLDIDPKKEPDILCSMDKIPVADELYDFVVAQHALEHIENQEKAIKEWLRIIKKGGFILIIHPDLQHTGKQKPLAENEGLQSDQYNLHYHERTLNEFRNWIHPLQNLGFTIVEYGPALKNWSFYFVLRKNK